MENKQTELNHEIVLKTRHNLHITGIIEVISATPNSVIVKSVAGPISVTGSNLKIKNLNNTDKNIDIDGEINEIKYAQKKSKIFQKVFK